MRTLRLLPRLAATVALLAAFAVVLLTTFNAQAEKGGDSQPSAQSSGGAALGTGLISLAPGQSVRVSAVNVGGKDIQLELLFVPVTEGGKAGVSIQCDLIVSPGDAATDVFQHPGGANVIQFYAQVRVRNDVKDLEKLVPSLQIINEETGMPTQVLSGFDFASIRPIWVPS
jgi:hypothetical protein